jgi:RHS repeat-associated protein
MQFRADNQVRANYRYDFFERINWRQTLNMTPAGATHYVQDLQGQLIVEATDTGTMLREYVWLDNIPLAVFADLDTASPQLYYVHPDHLNRPLRMTDGSQAVVWDATYSPFGEVHSITGSATLNLRFPGQYFVIENGLAYNWHRHYDPSLGRYTQPDPIADNRLTAPQRDAMYPASTSGVPLPFQDGPSVYAYALSSPAVYTDPTGEDVTICYYPSRTGGHVGFGVSGESGTHGFYPKDWYRIFNDPGEIRPDEQSGGQCKVIRTPPDKDQCMKQCRSRRDADPGLYNLFTRQCTSFVRECLLACGIDPGRYAGPFPEFFFKQ